MNALDHLPIPTFAITEQYAVIEASETARSAFAKKANLLDMVDVGSQDKLRRFVRPAMSGMKVELNFLTPNGIGLFDVFQRWRGQGQDMLGYIVCVPRQSDLNEVLESVSRLERRLETKPGANVADISRSRPTVWEHVTHSIHTIEELVGLLHADLIERGRGVYAELVLKELDSLRTLVAQEQKRSSGTVHLLHQRP
ncbi:hypothetical protein [Alicyclobacillus acidocaldarius]|uniref:Uncharacterized protein n=1 Tax=Alicyclobacillus acidocaldarius subsp. acidocaldarius (strain ATCC 27009 / DSM 446 / BCRC 14685 / JCM 5260 / KCTC 1825 / NBRC 15652 / NCIMB 11725 / NRRL B-14509 / 104-IA) TaxID=521098 RepID=C8WTI0_ALIAD|nr:hypothetical protein [Alicyclobacillus acidocaldarius]ACV57722.1 hypothetical protein Aaci_0674 [Alicyclobacillus acidocaldarius subsp. acidocaldarius DSM 446]